LAAVAGVAGAADKETASKDFTDNAAIANRAVYMADDAPSEGLLQQQMREHDWGGSTLSQYDLRLGGYIELGYSWNFTQPPGGDNGFGRLFDDKAQDPRIDQISLWLVRDVPFSRDQFDMGFGVQVIYGSDSRFIHGNGANFYGSAFGASPIQRYPDEQIDLTEAYLLMNFPWGNGLKVKAGKFVTPWGLEHIDPTQNLLYSHSIMFAVAQPQTLTGVITTYQLDENLWIGGGIVVGWDQAIEDNNDFPSFLAQVGYKVEGWDLVATALVGPERTGNRSDYRWLLNGTAKYKIDRDWSIGVEAVFGYEPDVGTEFHDVQVDAAGNVERRFDFTGDDTIFAGFTASSSYKLDEPGVWTLNARIEYFNNSDGGRWFPTDIWSGTAGLTIVPFANDPIGRNFSIRPEIRYDFSEDEIFDQGTKNAQITANIDAIFKF